MLAPLKGKEVLEIGCGNGIDACICAHNGAHVYTYDLCGEAAKLTQQRAASSGVSHRVHATVGEDIEQVYVGRKFDHVIGYAILHHLSLEGLAERVHDRLKPGGVAVFAEPVINSKWLDRLRRCIPLHHVKPTDDEMPLNDRVIAEFARPFDRIVRREFQCLSRIWPCFPTMWTLAHTLHWLDYHLLKVTPLRRFASVVVFGLYRQA